MVPGDLEMPVINPATEEVIARCARASSRQLGEAVAAAKAAFPAWAARNLAERQAMVARIADTIETHLDELATLLTREQGKPFAAAKGETAAMAMFFRHFASLDLAVEVLEESGTRRVELRRRPLGVVAAIVPWNYPLSILALKVPAALVAGNTVVLKPAPTTPLGTLRFAELVCDLLPPGVLNVVADANDLGNELCRHPDVRKISFTGSTATGRKVMESAAGTIKRLTLELGGNDAAIVLDDADVKAAAHGIFQGAFMNSGQVCFAIKRAYVQDGIYEQMCEALAALADAAVVGDGMEPGVTLGPLQNRQQFDKVRHLLEQTRTVGKVIAGGKTLDRPGYFMRPTIVRDMDDSAALVREEQFGPLLPLVRFSSIDDAIARANASEYGLGASVWSSDRERACEIANRLEAGTVWINKHLELPVHVPIAGAKQSGLGVEQGAAALAEFTQIQVINA